MPCDLHNEGSAFSVKEQRNYCLAFHWYVHREHIRSEPVELRSELAIPPCRVDRTRGSDDTGRLIHADEPQDWLAAGRVRMASNTACRPVQILRPDGLEFHPLIFDGLARLHPVDDAERPVLDLVRPHIQPSTHLAPYRTLRNAQQPHFLYCNLTKLRGQTNCGTRTPAILR